MSEQLLIFMATVLVLGIVAFAGLAAAVQVTGVAPLIIQKPSKKSRRRKILITMAVLFGVAVLFAGLIVATQGSSFAPLAGERFPDAIFWSDL